MKNKKILLLLFLSAALLCFAGCGDKTVQMSRDLKKKIEVTEHSMEVTSYSDVFMGRHDGEVKFTVKNLSDMSLDLTASVTIKKGLASGNKTIEITALAPGESRTVTATPNITVYVPDKYTIELSLSDA